MRTKEEYIKTFEKLAKMMKGNYKVEKFADSFSLLKLQDILDIKNLNEIFLKTQWDILYNRNQENDYILLQMLETNNCPMSIVEKIIYNSETFKKDIIHSVDRTKRNIDDELFIAALQYDISQKLFDTIYKYFGSEIVNLFDTQYHYRQKKIEKISESSLERICNKVKEEYRPPKDRSTYYISSNVDHTTDCFRYIKNHQYIKKLINEDIHENIRTALLNNFNLKGDNPFDAKLMNAIYDGGCVLEYIRNWTPYIKKEVTSSIYDAFVTGFDEDTGKLLPKPDSIYYRAKTVLCDLAEKEVLDEDYEYDLAMRILDQKNRATDNLTSAVFCHTKNPNIMKKIKDIKSGDKTTAYSKNKYLIPDVITERVDELMKKMKKDIEKGKEKNIPDVWYEYLADYCLKVPFQSEQYRMVAGICNKGLALNIATSTKTPKEDLIEFAQTYRNLTTNLWAPISTIAVGAYANIFCRENNISDHTREELMKYFCELPSSTTIKDLDNNRSYLNLSYATQSIKAIVNSCDRDEAKKVYEFLKDFYKNKTVSDKEKGILEYSIAVMEKQFEKQQERELFDKSNDLSKCPDWYLEERRRKLFNLLRYNPNAIDTYINLEEKFDEINQVYEECDKRGFFKEKEVPEK